MGIPPGDFGLTIKGSMSFSKHHFPSHTLCSLLKSVLGVGYSAKSIH